MSKNLHHGKTQWMPLLSPLRSFNQCVFFPERVECNATGFLRRHSDAKKWKSRPQQRGPWPLVNQSAANCQFHETVFLLKRRRVRNEMKTGKPCGVTWNKRPRVNSVFRRPLHRGVPRSPRRLSVARWRPSFNLWGCRINTDNKRFEKNWQKTESRSGLKK